MPSITRRALLVYSTMSHQNCSADGSSSLPAECAASLHEFVLGSVETVVADEPAREGIVAPPDSDEHGLEGRKGAAEWATGALGWGWRAGGGEDERGVSHWPGVATAVIDEGSMLVVIFFFCSLCGGDGGVGSAGQLEGHY